MVSVCRRFSDPSTTCMMCSGRLFVAVHLPSLPGSDSKPNLVHAIILWELRKVDLIAVMLRDKFGAVFEHSHHAQAEDIDLNHAHVGAVFLVPLNHRPAR